MSPTTTECRCDDDTKSCDCRCRSDEEIIKKHMQESGHVPPPLEVMSKRPGVLAAFTCYRDNILEEGPLSARDRALVLLTAAVAMRIEHCIGKLAKQARQAGIRQEEIVQATLIASTQSATSMLRTAHVGAVLE
jgi:alkylhydroperoxidase/carboxymuconolactone decarboxylase family protein YurZ